MGSGECIYVYTTSGQDVDFDFVWVSFLKSALKLRSKFSIAMVYLREWV